MNGNKPIAVFDSGVGGISVLRELYALMPNENYIYFGDSANAPYGSKSAREVLELSEKNAEMLIGMDAKILVIACNTATSAAASFLRKKYPDFPIIGVEPALKPAVLFKENSTVAVMATPITLRGKKFKNKIKLFRDQAKIIPIPAERLAGMIEMGIVEGEELEIYIKELFLPYRDEDIDSVVLGCTHYPFIKKTLNKVLGDIPLFDGGKGTAKETMKRLSENDLLNKGIEKGNITFLSSKESIEEILLYKKFFYLEA